jgi:hypothetical protein
VAWTTWPAKLGTLPSAPFGKKPVHLVEGPGVGALRAPGATVSLVVAVFIFPRAVFWDLSDLQ